jgi:alkylation response protein AidB-like acyl-CoA dehydrogenase
MKTRAVNDGSDWILNGSKNWISQAGVANVYVVFAVTDPQQGHSRGITAFLLERDRPGFTVGKPEHKLGIKGSPTAALSFEDVRIPPASRIIRSTGAQVGHQSPRARAGARRQLRLGGCQ